MSFQSILPPEALQPEQTLPPVEVQSCPYGKLEGYRDQKGKFVVSRILSTDPAAYLDSRYQPGSTTR